MIARCFMDKPGQNSPLSDRRFLDMLYVYYRLTFAHIAQIVGQA
jgi:hypothetical protein